MQSPRERYQSDPMYAHGVKMLENLLHQVQYTPSELREMALLACINYEMSMSRPPVWINPKAEEALKILADIRGGKK